jgi:hypothetical protein
MAANATPKPIPNLAQRVDRILEVGQIGRQEYFQLVSVFLSDFAVNEEERRQLNRLFDELQMNRIRFSNVDTNQV